MKVVCTAWWDNGIWLRPVIIFGFKLWSRRVKGPKHKDVATVTEEVWHEGERYYILLEWPEDDWEAKHFVPLQESTTEYKEVTFTEIKKETPIPSEN